MTADSKRCVVTGLGMICAIGTTVEESWRNALASVSGIRPTVTVDTAGCYATLAAEVQGDVPGQDDRTVRLCLKAAGEALRDASLGSFGNDPRVSVIMGSCVGGARSVERYYRQGKDPADIAKMPIASLASRVAEECGAGGVVTNVANACAAGTISIAAACDLIRSGKADVVVAGGADSFASIPYAGFLSLKALDANPCSPFNHCTGITLGEGAGAVIVESYAHAQARNARAYCEVLGSGITSDAFHITAPRGDGLCQIAAIRRALENSGVGAQDIGYINGHGTGTAKNDNAEFLSLHTLFDGVQEPPSISSTKAMTGHCLGAAGAMEAVFSIKALVSDTVLPTLGYSAEDSEALRAKAGRLDFVQNVPHARQLHAVMSNSFAFGGNNASIVFSKEPGDVPDRDTGRRIAVTGLGIVNALGVGRDAYAAAVRSGALPGAASIRSTLAAADFSALGVSPALSRKLDTFSQLQVISGMGALRDGQLAVTEENAGDIGIVVGTSEGALGSIAEFDHIIAEKGNAKGSAFLFPNTVYNAAGGYLSICSGIRGYGVTVTSGPVSGLTSIAYAAGVIRDGQASAVLATGNDENIPAIEDLFSTLGMVAGGVTAPYSRSSGFVLGDGGTALLVEDDSHAAARNATVYCHVLGIGSGRFNVPFGTLRGSGSALDLAIQNALADAGVAADEVDAVFGFANGMDAVDSLEVESYNRLMPGVPVVAVKERVGEGRAGAAALQAAHAALMLHGDIPQDSAYVFGADGSVAREVVAGSSLERVLVTSFATGGSYMAVVLGK